MNDAFIETNLRPAKPTWKSMILAIGVTIMTSGMHTSLSATQESESGLIVSTFTAEKKSAYETSRIFVGHVEARQSTEAGFELGGTLEEIYVEEGDTVTKGAVLARLDTDRPRAERNEVSAGLKEAKATLTLAESTLKRLEAVEKIRAISVQQLDEARQARDVASARLERQRAVLQRIDVDLDKSVLRAPFDAFITARFADKGRFIAPGTPAFRLEENTTLEARVGLANGLADRFTSGDKVTIRVSGMDLTATVRSVLSTRDTRARTVDLILSLPKVDNLRSGDLVELRLSEIHHQEGYWIPLSALTENVRGLWSVYSLNEDSTAIRKVVEMLYFNETHAYVRGNIVDGENLVAEGVHRLVPGQYLVGHANSN